MLRINIFGLAAAVVLAFAACRSDSYEICGRCDGLSDGDTVFITDGMNCGVFSDTAVVCGGKFVFRGVADSSVLCIAYCPAKPVLNMPFFLENGTILMKLSSSPEQARVSGTVNNNKWQKLMDTSIGLGLEIDRFAARLYSGRLDYEEQQALLDSIASRNERFGEIVAFFAEKEGDSDFGRFLRSTYKDFLHARTLRQTR